MKIPPPLINNPLYESAESHYESLPEPPSNVHLALNPNLPLRGELAHSDIDPPIPPPFRKAGTVFPREDKFAKLNTAIDLSLDGVSAGSTEDCYTVMNEAGRVTMLPRNAANASTDAELGSVPSFATKDII